MLGYVVVVAMVVCAIFSVVIATAGEDARQTRLARDRNANGRVLIAALGASDLTGEGTRDPARENWIAQLAAQLPAHVDIATFGIGGAWLADAQIEQVPKAVAVKPDIVIGWLIVNDLTQGAVLAEYIEILDAVLADLAQPGTRILLGNAPRLWELPAFTGDAEDLAELRHEVAVWNDSLAAVAAKYDVVVVDLHQNPVEIEDLSDDGFHPSPAGHAKLAATFRPYVLAALDQTRDARQTAAID
ncbi:MAG: SGNH/GDSL hydrolase family protein [Chloroflexota bacterium]|nr:SGNH/GDSL hydrolase family protein [Chloroflexota bacterium]